MKPPVRRRAQFTQCIWPLMAAVALLAGCATRPIANNTQLEAHARATATQGPWSGRLSLQIQSVAQTVAAQSFSVSFELTGHPERGALTVLSPLGNVLGVVRWSAEQAVLDSGNGQLQRFSSIESFLAQTIGAAVPIAALFGWLAGVDTPVEGWTADLSRRAEGRIAARRDLPTPQADLRVVLDQ